MNPRYRRRRCIDIGAWRLLVLPAMTICMALASAAHVQGQDRPRLEIEREGGSSRSVTVQFDRGYASVAATTLGDLGWRVDGDDGTLVLSAADEIVVSFRFDSPFFRWDGVVLQMTDAPYRTGGSAWIPLQFLTDFLPRRLPGLYDFVGEESLLRAGDVSLLSPGEIAEFASAGDEVEVVEDE